LDFFLVRRGGAQQRYSHFSQKRFLVKYSFAYLFVFLIGVVGCGKAGSKGASVDEAFRSAISADAQTLVSIKLDKLKASDLYRRHQQQLEVPQLNALSERVGLDPRRDLSNILLVWDGKHLLLLAAGGFSNAQIEAKLAAQGAQRASYKSFTLFTQGADAVSFPDRGFAIASSISTVQAALELRSSHGGAVPTELSDRLADVPADAQIWEVSRGGLPAANFPLRTDIASALSNITTYVTGTSAGLRFDSGSHLQARVVCTSPEGAQRVHDAMRGLIGLARLTTNDNQLDMLRMWDAVSITKDQQFVRIQADLPADLTDKLITQLSGLRGRAGAVLGPQ
jgi:hypothetical protein